MQLAGKKVVVVGGSSGIGLSTAELAKREGADVIIASRSAAKLDAIAEKLDVIAIPTDEFGVYARRIYASLGLGASA